MVGTRMTVLVFGSINMDLVARTTRLPLPGETLLGQDFFTTAGGKGANQAVAVARLAMSVQMVGRVGSDSFGQALLANLQTASIATDSVLIDSTTHSGVAMIAVDAVGQNQILVIPGTNGRIDESDVARLQKLLPGAAMLLLQLEIPFAAVKAAAHAARQAGVPVVLDPAPVQVDAMTDLYSLVDILTPNEVEASQLVGFPVQDVETASQAANVLRQRGVATVIVKLGDRGAVCATTDETFFVPAFAVTAVDTVAAGDAFTGGLVAALIEGLPLRQAVVWGAAAGALATTKLGAQSAMCDRATFDQFLAER